MSAAMTDDIETTKHDIIPTVDEPTDLEESYENTGGRPMLPLDWEKIGKLLEADCKTVDIAAQFGVTPSTLYERCPADTGFPFSVFAQAKKANGDNILRAVQFHEAIKGNTAMLIWLGKQRLDQVERREHTGRNGDPIEIVAMTRDQYDSLTK